MLISPFRGSKITSLAEHPSEKMKLYAYICWGKSRGCSLEKILVHSPEKSEKIRKIPKKNPKS
jgi:hypothetical protein